MKARISCRSLASVAVQFAQPYQLIVAVECIIGISVILVVHAGAPPCPADRQGGLFGPRRSVRVPHDHLYRSVVWPRTDVPHPHHAG